MKNTGSKQGFAWYLEQFRLRKGTCGEAKPGVGVAISVMEAAREREAMREK